LIVGPSSQKSSPRAMSPISRRDQSTSFGGRARGNTTSPKFAAKSITDDRKKSTGYLEGKEIELDRFISDGASVSKKGTEKEKERSPHLSPPTLVSNENSSAGREEVFTIFLVQNIHSASPTTLQGFYNIMSEGSLDFQGHSYTIPPLFMIIALTPFSELIKGMEDYFLFRVALDGPIKLPYSRIVPKLSAFNIDEVIKMIHSLPDVFVSQDIDQFIRTLVVELRNDSVIYSGPTAHACSSLIKASQSAALLNSLYYVAPHDVKSIAVQSLNHHLILRSTKNPNSPAIRVTQDIKDTPSSSESTKTVSILCGIVKTILSSLIPPV